MSIGSVSLIYKLIRLIERNFHNFKVTRGKRCDFLTDDVISGTHTHSLSPFASHYRIKK